MSRQISRYIDANKIDYEPLLAPRGDGGKYVVCEIAYKDEVDSIPTADVVEVVRCWDCKHLDNDMSCAYTGMGVKPDDYCSYGGRTEA